MSSDAPRAMVQRTGARNRGFMAWEAWVEDGIVRWASEWGTYAWTRRGAERKARKLLRQLESRRRPPAEEIAP